MLTSWGKKALSVIRSTGLLIPNVNVAASAKSYITAKNVNGDTRYIPPTHQTGMSWAMIRTALVPTGNSASVGVAFGSDGTAESDEDYTIGNIILGLTAATPGVVTAFDDVNYKYSARLDYMISNDTGADVTIREVCLFGRFDGATVKGDAAVSANRACYLIDRTVLDAPVTIANGSAAAVRYEFAY